MELTSMRFFGLVRRSLIIGAITCLASIVSAAQAGDAETKPTDAVANEKPAAASSATPAPLIDDLRGVEIGMTAAQVKKAIGKPTVEDATGMFFTFSRGQSLQLQLDADKKVSMLAMMYYGKDADAPTIDKVLGPSVPVEATADGRIFEVVRYPANGFSITYFRQGSGAVTTVTLNKLK
jgi:hypothetical protein